MKFVVDQKARLIELRVDRAAHLNGGRSELDRQRPPPCGSRPAALIAREFALGLALKKLHRWPLERLAEVAEADFADPRSAALNGAPISGLQPLAVG